MIPLTRRQNTVATTHSLIPTSSPSSPPSSANPFSTLYKRLQRTRPAIRLLLTILISLFLLLTTSFLLSLLSSSLPYSTPASSPTQITAGELTRLSQDAQAWFAHFDKYARHTERIGCREMDSGAQSCVFSGIACINTSTRQTQKHPVVYLLSDKKQNYAPIASDDWCRLRAQSSDPRYFSSRHWPIREGTVAPQRSCMRGYWRSRDALFPVQGSLKEQLKLVKWVPNLYLIDLDYDRNSHNNHLVKDIVWMLDVYLWQLSNDVRHSPLSPDTEALLFHADPHIYLPQSQVDFEYQTSKDVNRLNYAMVLRRNLSKLYPDFNGDELSTPAMPLHSRHTIALLDAYPDLKDKLVFHYDQKRDNQTQLVCTPRLSVGAKIGNGGHDRVCRYLRQRGWELFGIKPPEMVKIGNLYYPRPPKRVIILDRHISRKLSNAEELRAALVKSLAGSGVEVELIDTRAIGSAEDNVKVFSRAGVLITPHGSHAMGQIWMARHSALIEIMPVGYTDYAFNLLSDSCKLWYYELQSMLPPTRTRDFFLEKCGLKVPHMLTPCTSVKSVGVTVNVEQAVRTIRFALERIGYSVAPWMEFVKRG